ncbi:YjbF family lipoprotein [Roseovarius phycicola]|uniref:YjbF family lipoprotein n=1 Tax=Roseovarius phycicola TaxID=3080976 RepID=A0ABZ2HFF3_9RHOB
MKSTLSVLLVSFCLFGCGTSQTSQSPALWAQIRGQPDEVTPRYAALIKAQAPALQIGFPDTRKGGGTLSLEKRDGAFEYWLSPEGAQVILQSGMLHGLRGFGEGLLASELTEPLGHVLGLRPGESDRFHTFLDGNDRAVTRTYRCVFERAAAVQVDLAKTRVSTVLMIERCRSLDQSFENLYWVAPLQRQIVLSRQWAGPFLGALSMRVVP